MDYTELMLKSRKAHIAHIEFHALIDLVTVRDALDFANWYHSDQLSKLSQHDVIKSVCDHKQVDLVRHACKCKKCGKVMETEW